MESAEVPRRRGVRAVVASVGVLAALLVVIGPADPGFACDCSTPTDPAAFERSDAVFVGRLVDYEPPPDRAVMSGADPATWTFEVSDVYKGEVAAIQEVVSAVDGAACGLAIPREGEFLVFADAEGALVDVGDGQYYTGLCGGTRAASVAPLAVDAGPSPPEPVSETTSTTVDGNDAEAASAPPRPGGGTSDDTGPSSAMVIGGAAFALALAGATILGWRRVGRGHR